MNKLISESIQIAPSGGFTGFGKIGLQGSENFTPAGTFANIISMAIGIMTLVAAIWFIFLLISGAISYMSSGGDKGAAENARKRITNGVVGFIIVVISIFIVRLVAYLLGIPNILNFADVLMNISK